MVTKLEDGSLEYAFEPAIHRYQKVREQHVDAVLTVVKGLEPPPPSDHDEEGGTDAHAELRD
jgi:hypothetical protein